MERFDLLHDCNGSRAAQYRDAALTRQGLETQSCRELLLRHAC